MELVRIVSPPGSNDSTWPAGRVMVWAPTSMRKPWRSISS